MTIQAARRKEINAIVVYKLDRFGRSTSDLISTLQELDAFGCTFVSVSDAVSARAQRPFTRMLREPM